MHQPLPDPTFAVRCRNVSKSYGCGPSRNTVLRNLDLDIAAGALTFLVGPSGCGKTTLVSALVAMLQPDCGSVDVFGTTVSCLTGSAATRFRATTVGLVLQQFQLLPALTAIENVTVPLIIQGEDKRRADERAGGLLAQLGLGGLEHRYPEQLSTGQQQRVAIGRALIHEPRFVILDEPTAALDAESGNLVMQLLRTWFLRSDRAVLIVTHDSRILPFADRIAEMSDGRIVEVEVGRRAEAA